MMPTHNIDWDFIDSHPMADKPDEDSPELTDEDFASMRPASEALPEIFGATLAAEMLKEVDRAPIHQKCLLEYDLMLMS